MFRFNQPIGNFSQGITLHAEELIQHILSFPELCFYGHIQQYHGAFLAGFDEHHQQPSPAQFKRDGEHSDLEQPLHSGEQHSRNHP